MAIHPGHSLRRHLGFVFAFVTALVLLFSGCTAPTTAAFKTVNNSIFGRSAVDNAKLNPNFSYLRVVYQGHVAMLALGFAETLPNGDLLETFYSAQAESLQLLNGRIVSFQSTPIRLSIDRSATSFPLWQDIRSNPPIVFEQTLDRESSYQFLQKVRYQTKRLSDSPRSVQDLKKIKNSQLIWIEQTPLRNPEIQKSIFGLDDVKETPRMLYSEQCLAKDFCMIIQRWSATGPVQPSQSPTK